MMKNWIFSKQPSTTARATITKGYKKSSDTEEGINIDVGDSKNILKNGPSQFLSRYDKKNINQYHNNIQHIERNHFIATALLFQSFIEGIVGRIHIYSSTNKTRKLITTSSSIL